MLISEITSGSALLHDDGNLGKVRASSKRHRDSSKGRMHARSGMRARRDKTDVIAMFDDVRSGEIGTERRVEHCSCWIDLDEFIPCSLSEDKFPSHGRKILIRRDEAKQADGLGEKQEKAEFVDARVTELGVRFRLDGPEVLPVVMLPQLANES
jgi:hypothetical protein